MTTVQEITSDDSFVNTVSSLSPAHLAVIYFHAPWAAPCKQMSSILEALASTYPASSPIVFLSVNAEELPDVAETYDVTAVPLVVLQKDKKKLESISGSDAAKVRAAVESHYGAGANGVKTIPPEQTVNRPPEGQEATPLPPSVAAPASASAATDEPVDKEALFKRLEGLVQAAPVMLFMKGTPSAPQCGFSRKLVGMLREKSIRYGFFNILADDNVRQGLKEYSDWPTFPQLYLEGELIGGLDIVKEEFENNPEFLTQYAANGTAVASS